MILYDLEFTWQNYIKLIISLEGIFAENILFKVSEKGEGEDDEGEEDELRNKEGDMELSL